MSTASARPDQRSRMSELATPVAFAREHAWTLGVCVAMTGWTAVLFVIVRDAYLEFGSVASTWATWCRRSGARLRVACSRSPRGRRASRSSGWARTSIRSSFCSRRSGWSGRRRSRSCSPRSPSCWLGALPVFWLGRRHLGSETRCGTPRARLPRVPLGRDERCRRDPSRDVRDPVPPILRLVPRYGRLRAVRALRGPRDVHGRAHGAASRGPRASGTRSLGSVSPVPRSRWPALRGRSSPSTSSSRVRGRGQRLLRVLRPRRRIATGRGAHALHAIRARSCGASSRTRRRLPRLARPPAALPLRPLAGVGRGGAPAIARQYGSPTSAR